MMQNKAPRPALQRARNLRQNQTEPEHVIWRSLRAGRFNGYKFRRQYPVGPYIADFACLELRLIIEIDGSQHNDNSKNAERAAFLGSLDYEILRFWNNDVMNNTESVLEAIYSALAERRRVSKA